MIKKTMLKVVIVLMLLIGTSCQGYRFVGKKNPFAQYNIRRISIPAFLNQSTIPNLSSSFTSEISLLLREYDNLEIVPVDAPGEKNFIIGIIKSKPSLARTLTTSSQRVASNSTVSNVGARDKFSIPARTMIEVTLQIVVIKNPTIEELQVLKSSLGESLEANGKIVFNHTFNLSEVYTHEVFEGSANVVTSTQTNGSKNRATQELARQAASQFKDIILYAF